MPVSRSKVKVTRPIKADAHNAAYFAMLPVRLHVPSAYRWLLLFGVFSAISVSICTKLARSILMRDRNIATLRLRQIFENRFLNLEFCRRKTVLCRFWSCRQQQFAAGRSIDSDHAQRYCKPRRTVGLSLITPDPAHCQAVDARIAQ